MYRVCPNCMEEIQEHFQGYCYNCGKYLSKHFYNASDGFIRYDAVDDLPDGDY